MLSPGRVTLPFSDAECFCQSGFMAFIFRATAAPILPLYPETPINIAEFFRL